MAGSIPQYRVQLWGGAVGALDVPEHVFLWGLRLPICQGFDRVRALLYFEVVSTLALMPVSQTVMRSVAAAEPARLRSAAKQS